MFRFFRVKNIKDEHEIAVQIVLQWFFGDEYIPDLDSICLN
jgi:hypothetical protein